MGSTSRAPIPATASWRLNSYLGRAVRAARRAGFSKASACSVERMAFRPVCAPTLLRTRPILVEAGIFDYSASTALQGCGGLIEGFRDPDMLTESLERFSPPTNFWKRYRAELAKSASVIVIKHATCLRLSGEQTVAGLECASIGDMRFKVRARYFVLAVGGLETVRVLGHSGYGNHSGMLGRTYMCHIEAALGQLRLSPAIEASNSASIERMMEYIAADNSPCGMKSRTRWESSTPQFACIMRASSILLIFIPCSPRYI